MGKFLREAWKTSEISIIERCTFFGTKLSQNEVRESEFEEQGQILHGGFERVYFVLRKI